MNVGMLFPRSSLRFVSFLFFSFLTLWFFVFVCCETCTLFFFGWQFVKGAQGRGCRIQGEGDSRQLQDQLREYEDEISSLKGQLQNSVSSADQAAPEPFRREISVSLLSCPRSYLSLDLSGSTDRLLFLFFVFLFVFVLKWLCVAPSPLKAPVSKPVVKRKKGHSLVNPHTKRAKAKGTAFESDSDE